MNRVVRLREKMGGETAFISVMIAVGVGLRLAWLTRTSGGLTGFAGAGEATRIALTLAREGQFADAFGTGSGPTAHVMPVMPMLAGAVFRVFPAEGPAASLLLLAWSLGQSLGSYLLLRHLFAQLGAPQAALRWATIMLALAIVFASDETIAFRYWEGAAAVCLATAGLSSALAVEQNGRLEIRGAVTAALLWAAAAFVNPIVGLALAVVWAYVMLRRLPMVEVSRFVLLSASGIAVLITPWTIRNAEVLGAPVLLRSNFGLELAIGNHSAALSEKHPEQVYADRLVSIHPLHGAAARANMVKSGGEVPYNRALGADARRWIANHPVSFARLAVRHLRQFLFPAPWQMLFSGWEDVLMPRAVLVSLVNLAGMLAVSYGVVQRRPGYALLVIYVVAVSLPYALVQPIPRYTYLLWGLLAFAAWDGVIQLASRRSVLRR